MTLSEFKNLRSQIATSSWGGTRYPPFAFTEHGVAMLSNTTQRKKKAFHRDSSETLQF
ncbi:MAG: ORF6N domain-containing protein [Phycisphaerae bacterium]|nr:ORF6N domain-containing protein [Saprospiraceae bacterium]